MSVLDNILSHGKEIDPDDFFGGFGTMMSMDASDIHDNKIWDLYKICGKDLIKTVGCVRACQLGILPEKELHEAIEFKAKINVDDVVAKVQERLPRFGKVNIPNQEL